MLKKSNKISVQCSNSSGLFLQTPACATQTLGTSPLLMERLMEMTVNDEKSFRFSLLCLRMICPKSMADFFTLYAGFVQSLWMISINFARFMHAALFLRDLCYWSAAADVETGRSCVSKPRFDSLCNLYRLHLSLFAEFYTLVVQYIYIFYAFSFLFKLFF